METDEDSGLAKIVIECGTINPEVLTLGQEEAQIDLQTYSGIRISRSALHIVDGQNGVYVAAGNLQRFRKITILYEDEDYILVPDDGAVGTDNEVRLYDEVIVAGTDPAGRQTDVTIHRQLLGRSGLLAESAAGRTVFCLPGEAGRRGMIGFARTDVSKLQQRPAQPIDFYTQKRDNT